MPMRTFLACVAVMLALIMPSTADRPSRKYWPVTLAALAATPHPYVCTQGRVALVKREADGDLHVRLEAGGAFGVMEALPELPMAPPVLGTYVEACGIPRYDGMHKWGEIHPVLKPFRVVKRGA